MSIIIRRVGLLESYLPLYQCTRLRSKINIQKPKPPHHEKAKFLAIAKPFYKSSYKGKQPVELCRKDEVLWPKDGDNPFQRIIAMELLRWFQSSRLIGFYHANPMNADAQFKAFAMFKKQNMHFKNYGKTTMKMALEGTAYEPCLDFYISRNLTAFSPEPKIKEMLKITRRFPQIILMAAIYEGKLVSKDELVEYSLIPDLRTAQAGLVQTLNTFGTQITGQLTLHQNTLTNQLEERLKQLKEN